MNSTYQNTCYLLAILLSFLLTLILGPFDVSAQGGYTLDFDGVDDYVEIPYNSSLNPATNFTVECWAKVEGGSGTWRSPVTSRAVPGAGNTRGYQIYAGTDDQWQFWTGSTSNSFSSVNSNIAVSSTWTHIAGTFDGTTLRIYVNGELANSAAGNYTANPDKPLRIGAGDTEVPTPFIFFPGKIDEVRVWDDVRTEAEIQGNMHKELQGNEANLVAYYQMSNETGTSLTDNSPNSNTGTFNNTPVWKTSGALAGSGMALDFDGSDDFVFASLNTTATNSLTIEGWFSFNSLTNQQNLLRIHQTASTNTRIVPYKTGANLISFYIYDGSSTYIVNSTFTISQVNTWNHLAFVYDAGTVSIYANGNLVGSASSQGSFSLVATNNISIGNDSDGISGGFHSHVKIDEIRVWGDARTEVEIRTNMYRTLEGDEANLVAYYRFDQQAAASNTSLYDLSSNANNGTLINMDGASDWVSSTPFNTWIGSEDGNWNNADNWGNGSVPSTEDVGIYAWSGNNLPATANISSRNFYLDNGVTLNHSGNLTLSGDYYNAGTFTTTGNVTFSGSTTQSIRGAGTSTFGTLTVNNATGVTLEQNVTATSSLTFTSGDLNLNSQTLTLGNSASIGGSPGISSHVVATSGNLTKGYSGTGSFAFPVGDGAKYTPITLNFTTGTFSSGNASVNLTAGIHPSNSSSSDYLSRYWTVNSSGISSFSCDVTATYDDIDISGTEGNMVGGKWDGSSWINLGSVTAGSNQITGTVSSFSDFTAGEPAVFPVEWLDITAELIAEKLVQLNWITANELNADFFAIERSQDQSQWNQLGTVRATGNSQKPVEYVYKDLQPLRGSTYYRLRQVDMDGAFDYSSTVEVNWADHPIRVYPNPVVELLHIELPKSDSRKLEVFDINGRIVLKAHLTAGKHSIHLAHFSPGRYILQLKDKKGRIREFQVVKE